MAPTAFRRVMTSPFQTTKANGTGLGLYISRHILRRHKATVRWQNKPGSGMKVMVLFPAVKQKVVRSHELPHKQSGLFRRLLGAFALLSLALMPLSAARFPQLLRLQGRFTDTRIPMNDEVPVRFTIWDTPDGYGNLLWEDVQSVIVKSDVFQVLLGKTKALTPSVFSGGDRWVELQIGTDAPLRPRYRIPNQYLQAEVAAVQAVPAPVVAPPPPPVAAPVAAATITDQERHDLELQIDKYKEPEREPVRAPVRVQKPKPVPTAEENSGELGSTYEVKAGDTLKSIAQKLYGNAELWYDLYYLNRDRLGPMGHLFPGQILVLPSTTPGAHSR